MLEQQHTKSIFEQYVLEKQDHPKTKKITPTYLLSWTRTFHSLAYVFLLADQKFLNLRLWWKNRSFVFTTVYFIIFSCIQTNSRIFPRYKNTQILGNLQTVLTALSMETLHFQSSGFFFFVCLEGMFQGVSHSWDVATQNTTAIQKYLCLFCWMFVFRGSLLWSCMFHQWAGTGDYGLLLGHWPSDWLWAPLVKLVRLVCEHIGGPAASCIVLTVLTWKPSLNP